MIYKNSRYAASTVSFLEVDGAITTYISRRPAVPAVGVQVDPRGATYSYKIVVEGDRLDLMAYDYYGDSRYWWILADLNPQIDSVLPLIPGTVMRVPRA
jgi:hypothetical protein